MNKPKLLTVVYVTDFYLFLASSIQTRQLQYNITIINSVTLFQVVVYSSMVLLVLKNWIVPPWDPGRDRHYVFLILLLLSLCINSVVGVIVIAEL